MDIRMSDTIVCYDTLGMLAAPRVSWMFRAFGAKNVYVLNGTFKKWVSEQLPTFHGQYENEAFTRMRTTQPEKDDYDFKLNQSMVESY